MEEATSRDRLQRAKHSRARASIEQLDLQPRDLVDFWRHPTTKDESGWRGPARVVETGPPILLQWQGKSISVRPQDVRRALVCAVFLMLPEPMATLTNSWFASAPLTSLRAFADGLNGQVARLGWIRTSDGWC